MPIGAGRQIAARERWGYREPGGSFGSQCGGFPVVGLLGGLFFLLALRMVCFELAAVRSPPGAAARELAYNCMTGRAKWWENEAHDGKHAVQPPHSASRPAWQRSTQLRDALQQLSPRAGRGHAQVRQVWLIEQLQRLQVDLGVSEFRGEFAHA
jgi:hypothetical protein